MARLPSALTMRYRFRACGARPERGAIIARDGSDDRWIDGSEMKMAKTDHACCLPPCFHSIDREEKRKTPIHIELALVLGMAIL